MGRGIQEYDSMEDWLNAPAPGQGKGGGKFLKNWKNEGEVKTVQHSKCLPLVVWRHGIPTYVILDNKEDRDEKIKRVFPKRYTCHEEETVLDSIHWREEDGTRKQPPKKCGGCKTAEWFYQQTLAWLRTHKWSKLEKKWIEKKEGVSKGLDPCKVAFKYVGDVDEDKAIIHVGGLCGYFGKKELPRDVIRAMAAHHIRRDLVFKENWLPKPSSVMCVVKYDDPKQGVVIAEETKALGEKVKEAIRKVYKSQRIHIQKEPYVIQWEYDKNKAFDKRYDATPLTSEKLSPRILKLVRGDAPDLTEIRTPFNQQSMRAALERYCLIKNVPWDKLFPTREQEEKWNEEEDSEESEDEDEDDAEDIEEERPARKSKKVSDEDEDDDEDDDDEDEEEDVKLKKKSSSKKSSEEDEDDDEEDDEEEDDEEEEVKPKKSSSKKASEDEDDEEEEEVKPKKKSSSKKSKDDDEDEEEDEDEDDDEDDDEEEEVKPKKKSSSKKSKDDEDEDKPKLVKCDECGKPMRVSASECPHCGHDYTTEDDDEKDEEEEKPKKKSSSKKAKDDDEDDDDDEGDEIGF